MNQIHERLKRIAGGLDKSSADNNLRRAQISGSDLELQTSLRTARFGMQLESRAKTHEIIELILEDPERRLWLNATARQLIKAPMNEEQTQYLKAVSEDSTPGSTMIQDSFADDIYNLLALNGAWATLGVVRLRSKKGKFAITTAYPNAVFVDQGIPMNDDTAFTGSSFLSDTKTVACLIKCSIGMYQDAEIDLSAHLLECFSEAFNARLDTAAFIGTGIADANNAGMTGIFVDDTIPSVDSGAGNTALELCGREDFLRVIAAVSANALQRPCRWWLSAALLPMIMRCVDRAGRPLVCRPPGEKDFYLIDFPVTLVPVAPSDNTPSKKVIAFGDPRAYAVALRNWFQFDVSGHAQWNTLERNFRAYGNAKAQLRNKDGLATLKLSSV